MTIFTYLELMETILVAPNENELEEIYRKAEDTEKCSGQWTAWNSAANPLRYNGNDYETLRDHRINFK